MAEDIFRPRFSEQHAETLLWLLHVTDEWVEIEKLYDAETLREFKEFADWFRKSHALHKARLAVNARFEGQG